MLKIGLHVHTSYSDSRGSVEEVIAAAERKGLDGIAITDHNNLRGAYDAFEKKGKLIVILGEEVMTNRGEIIALGIKRRIPKNLPITEAIDMVHDQGGLVVIPHPTLPFFSKLKEKDLKNLLIDGLEVFSAITPFSHHFLMKNLALTQRLGLSVTVGSDSHIPETVGDAYTLIDSKSRNLEDILYAIRTSHTSVMGSPSKLKLKLKTYWHMFLDIFLRRLRLFRRMIL